MKKKKSGLKKKNQPVKHAAVDKVKVSKKSGILKEKKNHTDNDFHHEHPFVDSQ